jgi:hypothetical protein
MLKVSPLDFSFDNVSCHLIGSDNSNSKSGFSLSRSLSPAFGDRSDENLNDEPIQENAGEG